MGLTTRYGGTKIPPREIIGYVYRVDLKNRNEVMKSEGWKRPVDSETKSLKANETWELMLRSDEMRPLQTMGVFKTKTSATETLRGTRSVW